MIRFQETLFAGFLIRASLVISTASFLPPDFVFWFYQSSIVQQDWLYIDGGEIWARWYGALNGSAVWNLQTIAIDLRNDWNTSTIPSSLVVATNKSIAMAPMKVPDLFYNPQQNVIYSLGGNAYGRNGSPYNSSQAVQLWGFEYSDNGAANWQLEAVGSTVTFPLDEVVASALTATSSTNHYSLGGYSNSDVLGLDEFITYDFANNSWTNRSLTNSIPNKYYTLGRGQYISAFGDKGVILFFGGVWPSTSNGAQDPNSLANLNTVLVYDVASNTFFNPQQTTGTVPLNRWRFCSVGAGNGTGNSSYEIFLFGGSNGQINTNGTTTATELATVYILTLPAFSWIKTSAVAPIWRWDHTCSVIRNRQMVSIGGMPDFVMENSTWIDPWDSGMQVLDMTELSWSENYDSSAAAYEPPSVVMQYYEENSRYPVSWVDPTLQAIFSQPNSTITPGSGYKSNTTTSGSRSKINTGAIAGGAIGGVLACLTSGLVFWCVKRQKRQRRQRYTLASTAPPPPSPPAQGRFEVESTDREVPMELDGMGNPMELAGQGRPGHELE